MKLRIIIDMDEVIVDNYAEFHRLYEERYGKPVDPADYAGRKIYQIPGTEWIREQLYEPGHFRHLPLMEGAAEVVRELYERHEVWIVTAAMEFKHSFLDKYEWLHEYLPFVDWRRVVFCGDKSIVHGDYMIDDKAKNLAGFNGTGLLFAASHNRDETGYHRVANWGEVRDYFRGVERSLQAREA